MKRLILFIGTASVSIFLLSGCGLAYQAKSKKMLNSATTADFGSEPPIDHQEMEKALIRPGLKDPDSAKFDFGAVVRTTIPSGFASPTPILVWRTDVNVNARNSFGGYTGFQPYHFAWRDGRLIAVSFPNTSAGVVTDGLWRYLK